MLEFYFDDYCYITPFFLVGFYQWYFFIKNNFFVTRLKPLANEKLTKFSVIKKLNYKCYVLWNILTLFLLFISISSFYGVQQTFWWNHFKLSNFNLSLVLFLITINLILNFFLKFLNKVNINYSIDYFFALANLSIILLMIFFSNTIYTFIFILELNSNLIFYKFVVSKFWFKSNKFSFLNNFTKFNKILPKFYLNMLFFQYWVTFFSSILLLYSLINLIMLYGSSEWIIVDFLTQSDYYINYNNNWFFLIMIWFTFFLGLFLKIGFTPLHLFKIEVYKGLPFISIFFYTIYYFLVFFLFFVILIMNYIHASHIYWWFLIFVMLILGGIYIIFLFFDVNYIKAFFAYSTIINSYSLFCVVMTLI